MYRHSTDQLQNNALRLLLPQARRNTAIRVAHTLPMVALGFEHTKYRLLQHFYWPTLIRDVRWACKSCPQCQKAAKRPSSKAPKRPSSKAPKRPSSKAPLISLPIMAEPFDRVAIDMVGPLTRTTAGNKYILALMNYGSRYPEAIPLKNINSQTVASALVDIFSRLGISEEILSDQGEDFISKLM